MTGRPDGPTLQERRGHQRWTGLEGVLELGGVELPVKVVGEPRWEMHSVRELVVTTPNDFLSLVQTYTDEVRLSLRFTDGFETVLGGYVARVDPRRPDAEVVLDGFVEETWRTGGMAFDSELVRGELGPLLARLLRRSDIELDLTSLNGSSTDDLLFVTVPVDGVDAAEAFTIGQVIFSGDSRIGELGIPANADPVLVERFCSAKCWATLVLQGKFGEYAIEAAAVRTIDAAISWLMAMHATGRPSLGDHRQLPFQRAWVRSRPSRRPVSLVCGDRSGTRMLKGEGFADDGPELGGRGSTGLPVMPLQFDDDTLLEALMAWRRSVESFDHYQACAALCEAIECVVATTRTPPTFSKDDIATVRSVLPAELTDAQRHRLEVMIGTLNQPSLMERIAALSEQHGIEFSDEDLAAFKKVRAARNGFVHGRGRGSPDWQSLQRARRWSAEIILRLALAQPNDGQPAGLIRPRAVRTPSNTRT